MRLLIFTGLLFLSVLSHSQQTRKAKPDSTQIRTSVTAFYKWYTTNWKNVTAFKIYKGQKQKDAPPYIIDWKEANRYFSYLRKNAPNLGEAFIEKEKAAFKESEAAFKDNPDDEIASGFDYDHFTNSQEEPKFFLNLLTDKETWWEIKYSGKSEAVVSILPKDKDENGADYRYLLVCIHVKKTNGRWLLSGVEQCEDLPPVQEKMN